MSCMLVQYEHTYINTVCLICVWSCSEEPAHAKVAVAAEFEHPLSTRSWWRRALVVLKRVAWLAVVFAPLAFWSVALLLDGSDAMRQVCVCLCACACVCVCARVHACMRVCVCVCAMGGLEAITAAMQMCF